MSGTSIGALKVATHRAMATLRLTLGEETRMNTDDLVENLRASSSPWRRCGGRAREPAAGCGRGAVPAAARDRHGLRQRLSGWRRCRVLGSADRCDRHEPARERGSVRIGDSRRAEPLAWLGVVAAARLARDARRGVDGRRRLVSASRRRPTSGGAWRSLSPAARRCSPCSRGCCVAARRCSPRRPRRSPRYRSQRSPTSARVSRCRMRTMRPCSRGMAA